MILGHPFSFAIPVIASAFDSLVAIFARSRGIQSVPQCMAESNGRERMQKAASRAWSQDKNKTDT